MRSALQPTPALLSKLGSIVIHTEEMLSSSGHDFDLQTIKNLLSDPEVKDWILEMNNMAMLPIKRNKTK